MEKGNLDCPTPGQEPQRAVRLLENRHLNSLTEFNNVNVGDCPETDVPSSREEKQGQRRSLQSSQRPGKPATGRREAEVKRPKVTINLERPEVGAMKGEHEMGYKFNSNVGQGMPNLGKPDAVKVARPVWWGESRNLHIARRSAPTRPQVCPTAARNEHRLVCACRFDLRA